MAGARQVRITMSSSTVAALERSGFCLYGMAAVQVSNPRTMPTVCLATASFAQATEISVEDVGLVYTSADPVAPGQPVRPAFAAAMEPGQLLAVTQPDGSGAVSGDGGPSGFAVANETAAELTAGLAWAAPDGAAIPMSASPLPAEGFDLIAPLDRVLLAFAALVIDTGSVVEVLPGPGVLIDLIGADERDVGFDINTGWSWGGYAWAQAIRPNTTIVPLLVEPLEELARAAAKARRGKRKRVRQAPAPRPPRPRAR